jgi:hypothetical protein
VKRGKGRGTQSKKEERGQVHLCKKGFRVKPMDTKQSIVHVHVMIFCMVNCMVIHAIAHVHAMFFLGGSFLLFCALEKEKLGKNMFLNVFFISVKCVVLAKNCHFGEIKTLRCKEKDCIHVHDNTRKI